MKEQTLIKPAYRLYLLLDTNNPEEKKLYQYLKQREAEYLPYLGKNEFPLYWDQWREYKFEAFSANQAFRIHSLFYKKSPVKESMADELLPDFAGLDNEETEELFSIFERLPIGYRQVILEEDGDDLFQYEYCDFVYTNWRLEENAKIENLYKISPSDHVIQIF